MVDQDIVDAIQQHVARHGYAISIRELCERFGWASTDTCAHHLHRLRRSGLVEWNPGESRTLRVVRR